MRRALLLLAMVLVVSCRSTPRSEIDLVLLGGKVFTGDAARPWAEAIAIRGDRIATVGSTESIRAFAGPKTRVIDLAGRVVVPGINDAHVHVPWMAPGTRVEIPGDASVDQVFALISEAAKKSADGTWLMGTLPPPLLEDERFSRETLDAVAPGHPVALDNLGGHAAVLNTAALRAWKIGDTDADPPGGHYGRVDGRVNGWVFEHALWTRRGADVASQSDDAIAEEMRAFASDALRYGVTTVQSMPAVPMDRVRSLLPRVPSGLRWRWMNMQMMRVEESPRMPVKYILDGTPLERGAAFSEAYADRAGESGRVNYTDDQIRRMVAVAARGEQPLLVHIAGDVPIRKLFAAMNETPADWPSRRVRIEHGDMIAAHIDDARRLGVVVVQNPSHFMLPQLFHARLGADRLRTYLPFRSLIERGIPVAIGSDGPFNPWLNVMFATIHPTNPAEAITREQAVILYTRGSAYAEFAEHEKGTLARGMLADLAVLSQDVFTVPTPELPRTESVLTIVGGKVVYER